MVALCPGVTVVEEQVFALLLPLTFLTRPPLQASSSSSSGVAEPMTSCGSRGGEKREGLGGEGRGTSLGRPAPA